MVNICLCREIRAVGLAILAYTLGVMLGMLCPLQILAIVELLIMAAFGYLCLFKA